MATIKTKKQILTDDVNKAKNRITETIEMYVADEFDCVEYAMEMAKCAFQLKSALTELDAHKACLIIVEKENVTLTPIEPEIVLPGYKAVIREQGPKEFYALVIRVDRDGEQNVINHYKGRFFKTMKAAIKSTDNYLAKNK